MARWSVVMSVLNQMLRDLEKRGAMPDLIAAAGTATVARPALSVTERPRTARRRWVWATVLAVCAVFVGIHSWLGYRVQEAAAVRAPLGARQFASVVAPAATVAAPATPPPVALAPTVSQAVPAPPTTLRDAPKPPVVSARARRVVSAPRPQATTPTQAAAPEPAQPVAADPAAAAVVARSTGEVNRDVDRAADLIARGRANEAMELLVQVLNRQPTNAAARSSLAALLAEAGRREQALHVLLAGCDVDAGRFAMPAAQLQAELGDLQGALQTLMRVPPARRNAGFEARWRSRNPMRSGGWVSAFRWKQPASPPMHAARIHAPRRTRGCPATCAGMPPNAWQFSIRSCKDGGPRSRTCSEQTPYPACGGGNVRANVSVKPSHACAVH
jgi:hypothetical protein